MKEIIRKRRSETEKAKRQQRDRSEDNFYKKACECSLECDADI